MMKKGIIFDMDGTVWDSSENVARSWTVKLHEAGYTDREITRGDIQSVMGKTMDVIADILFPFTEKGPERDTLRYSCQNYEVEYLRENGGILYDGILDTWIELKRRGYHIYIVSNCQSGYIESFLEYYHIPCGTPDDVVEDIECYGNNLLQKSENIRLVVKRNGLDEAWYVGDTQGDLDSATDAGIPFVYASYGFGTVNRSVQTITKFSDLLNLF